MDDIIRVAIIGAGKIAGDMHAPTIARHPRFECVCTISPHGTIGDLPGFPTVADALASASFGAVAVCTPPQVRYDIALECIAQGRHVLLEKPPAETPEQAVAIHEAAKAAKVTVYASWHSRFSKKVGEAKDWIAQRSLARGSICWREDVFKWHPGQDWLWAEGGLGVFDPGINPLSILTELIDVTVAVDDVQFDVPENAATPVAARLTLRAEDIAVSVDLSFLERKGDIWSLRLEDTSGSSFTIDYGDSDGDILDEEYFGLYNRFAALIDAGKSEVDIRPLELVAEAFQKAKIRRVAPIPV
jgi:D-galactose 1-dehydrogenase